MRSLIVTEFMSLDGVVDSPGGGSTRTPAGPSPTSSSTRPPTRSRADKQKLTPVEHVTYANDIQLAVYDVAR